MYRIKHFGALIREEQVGILKAFQDKDDKILFPYCSPELVGLTDEKMKKLVEGLAEDTSQEYFEGIIYIYDDELKTKIRNKIEKIAYEYFQSIKDMHIYSFNDLISSVSQGNLEKLSEKVANDIKYMISYELLKNNYDKVEYKQMKDRMVFQNKVMIDEEGECESETDILWYSIESDEELWKEMNSLWGSGMVIANRTKSFELYNYALICVETAEDYDLLIYPNQNRGFEEIVVPKISEINQEVIENIEEY